MKILLDTQCWLWMNAQPDRLSVSARRRLSSLDNELYLSSASVWEIVIKYSLGKLPLPETPAEYVPSRLTATRTSPLSIQHRHALKVAELPRHHGDPFDRMLIAQALVEGFPIMSADDQFQAYDLEILPP